MTKAKILMHADEDKYHFDIVNSLGAYQGNVSLEKPYNESSLDNAAQNIAHELYSLEVDLGQYEEKNGLRFKAFWTFSSSGTSREAQPINPKIAYDLHWRLLNKMLEQANKINLEEKAVA